MRGVETYEQAVRRVIADQRIHPTWDADIWLRKQQANPPCTDAERRAAAYFSPWDEGADVVRNAARPRPSVIGAGGPMW